MLEDTIFDKIIKKKILVDIIYQDNLVTAFKDINPQAPIHILIIPNIRICNLNDVKEKDEKILGRLITASVKIAKKNKIDKSGYRIIINCNKNGGQEIYYLHLHLLGGKYLGPIICNKLYY